MVRQLLIVLAVILSCGLVALAADVTPAPPVVPLREVNLLDFGGVADGKAYNTEAFGKAVAALNAAGGGHLIVPQGVFLTMPFSLASHLDLHLQEGAVIQFPADLTAYGLPNDPQEATQQEIADLKDKLSALVSGQGLTDVSITGSGIIDGGGQAWWALTTKDRPGMPHTAYGNNRPKLVVLTNCQRVLVQGVTIRNSPMYQLVPKLSKDVLVQGVHVFAPPRAPNTDAIDPMACDGVLIQDCDLDTGDDCVAIKAIEGPCTNIVVENCRCKHGHGISIGSETYKGIHDVTVRDCTFDGTTNGIRIKSARDRGNDLYGFNFSNIAMKDVGTAITINMYYMDRTGSRDRAVRPVTASTPMLHDVHIDNVTINGAQVGCEIIGLPESAAKNITVSHTAIRAAKGIVVRDAQGVVFNHVTVSAMNGDVVSVEHADLKWTN